MSDIISFLAVKNASLLCYQGDIPVQVQDEILEFYDYFMENFDEITYQARMENWGMEPYIFRLAESIIAERELQEQARYVASLTEFERHEAETLCDTIFEIRKERRLTVSSEISSFWYDIPKTMPRDYLEEARGIILFACARAIKERGAVVVRTLDKNKAKVFGVRVLPNGMWSPISKEEMFEAATHTPTGIQLEPEEGVEYTEIMREKF